MYVWFSNSDYFLPLSLLFGLCPSSACAAAVALIALKYVLTEGGGSGGGGGKGEGAEEGAGGEAG